MRESTDPQSIATSLPANRVFGAQIARRKDLSS